MSKKSKKTKKTLKRFAKKNRVLLGTIGVAAAGIALAAILGTDKAKGLLKSMEGNVKGLAERLTNDNSIHKQEVADA